jgi:hypothetical protein
MPINEAAGVSRRGGLTKQEKREAEAAIYGVSLAPASPNLNSQESFMSTSQTGLSAEEIERMRAIIAQHDQQNPGNGIKEFDLNNPPVEPYRHKEFPLHLTSKDGKVKVAHNDAVAAKLARKGYLSPEDYRAHVATLTPAEVDTDDDDDEDLQLDAETAAEAAELDAKLKAPKPSRAKPKPE